MDGYCGNRGRIEKDHGCGSIHVEMELEDFIDSIA
jgi:hypothetical protein